jgi:hypothetical protein
VRITVFSTQGLKQSLKVIEGDAIFRQPVGAIAQPCRTPTIGAPYVANAST